MKGENIFRKCCLVLLVAISMATAMVMTIPAAYAVVKNVTIVDAQGNSLANTKVTIVFPDGTEVEEETDDDGILVYDFPGDGEYTVNYPGGQMAVSVGGGSNTWKWVAGGVAAAGLVWVIADDDSDNNSPSNSPSDPGGSDPGSGSGTCEPGDVNVSTTINSNPGSHPNEFDGIYSVACSGSDATISTVSVGSFSATWNCTIDSGDNCNAVTDCMYAGFSTSCSLNSTSDTGGASGTISAGDDGALPGGDPIVVDFTAVDL